MITRQLPWQPVGKDLSGSTTVLDALNKADLNFSVIKEPACRMNGKVIPGVFNNIRSDTEQYLGTVTDKYQIIQNIDAFDFVDSLVPEGFEFEKGGAWHSGRAIWVEGKLPGSYKIFGDEIEPHVVFVNSHDGKGSVRVCMLPNRIFCSNQLNFVLKTADRKWSAIHSSNINAKIAVAQKTLGLGDIYMKELVKEADRLALKKVDDNTFMKMVEDVLGINVPNVSSRKLTNADVIKDGIMDCLKAPDMLTYKDTAYGKMMAVTDYFQHADPLRNTTSALDRRWESVALGEPRVDEFYRRLAA